MRNIGHYILGACGFQCGGSVTKRARRIDDVIDENAEAVLHIADDVHHLRFACPLPPLIINRQRRVVESLGESPGADNTANVGGDDNRILVAAEPLDVRRATIGGDKSRERGCEYVGSW